MIEIESLDEEEGNRLNEIRKSLYEQYFTGLGPDDCVIIAKKLNNSPQSDPIYFCHTLVGLSITSLESFKNYFQMIEKYQEKENKKNRQKYQILGGKIRIYNSFSNEEFTIQIDLGKTLTSNISTLTDQNFQHFEYSSILRYYRSTFPLFVSMAGGFAKPLHHLNVHQPRPLSHDEINYITKRHPISNELQFAIAQMMPLTQEAKSIAKYLTEVKDIIPYTMTYIHQILPKNRELSTVLYFFLENHLDSYCDDLNSAIIVANHYCNKMKIDKCNSLVPLLRSNIWSNPKCAICMGRICTANKKYEDAFHYFNLASISSGWPELPDPEPFSMLTKEEMRILKKPLSGPYYEYINAIIELCQAIGEKPFFEQIDLFSRKHELDKIPLKTEPLSEYCPESLKCANQDELYLYDPGICAEPSIKNALLDAPFSSTFSDVLKEVKFILSQYTRLLNMKTRIDQDHVGNLIIGLRMNDAQLMMKIFRMTLKVKTITIADYFVMLKGIMQGVIQPNDDIMKTYPYNVSIPHKIQLDYARNIVAKLIELPVLAETLA